MKTMTLLFALVSAGCWMSDGPSDRDDVSLPDDGDPRVVVPPLEAACARTDDGEFDFAVRGEGFEQYEGSVVHASAIEPADTNGELVAMRDSSVVGDDGRFALSCPRAIHYNMAYPSFALYLDVDRDGACSDADLGYEELYYGWLRAIDVDVPASEGAWFSVQTGGPFGRDFCAYYDF